MMSFLLPPELDQMKHFLTFLAFCAANPTHAQSALVPPAYNPDVNGDGYIAIVDVLEVLLNYGDAFAAPAVWCSDSSALAIELVPDNIPYSWADCANACRTLNGDWTLPQGNEASWVLGLSDIEKVFIETDKIYSGDSYDFAVKDAQGWTEFSYTSYSSNFYDYPVDCFCVTRIQPAIEYTYCEDDWAQFQVCVNEKIAEGWIPLGGMAQFSYSDAMQAFWRYSE